MNVDQAIRELRADVVRPCLQYLDMHSSGAEDLMIAVAIHESGALQWRRQLAGGPARGLWQVEPTTERSIFDDYLAFRPRRAAQLQGLLARGPELDDPLADNDWYCCALARIIFWRVPNAMVERGNRPAQARCWKDHYNTIEGAGTVEDFLHSQRRYNPGNF